jgi:poly(3-hydroxybutyrate) depolymerase
MLYLLHEFSRASTAPWLYAAQLGRLMLSGWPSAFAGRSGVNELAANCDLAVRLMQHYEKPEFGIKSVSVNGKTVAVSEQLVLEKPFCRLLRFSREGGAGDPKVLLFAPLSGHHATLLRPTVQELVSHHEVFITDWANAKNVPLSSGDFTLDDYVAYVREFLRFLGPGVHVVAVCQPTVPVLAAVALMAEDGDAAQPRTMSLMGGPIDTRASPTAVNVFASSHDLEWFRRHVIQQVPFGYPGQGRKVYPGFMQLAAFVSMNRARHAEAHWRYRTDVARGNAEESAQHRRFYDEYNAVLDMPASFFLQTIDQVFLRHTLAQREMSIAGRRVDLAAIRKTALFTVEGGADDICGRGQTEAAHALCRSLPQAMHKHLESPDTGHYGIFSGSRFRGTIAPALRQFICEHDSVASPRLVWGQRKPCSPVLRLPASLSLSWSAPAASCSVEIAAAVAPAYALPRQCAAPRQAQSRPSVLEQPSWAIRLMPAQRTPWPDLPRRACFTTPGSPLYATQHGRNSEARYTNAMQDGICGA